MKKAVLVVSVIAGALLLSQAVMAFGPRLGNEGLDNGADDPGARMECCLNLALTEEQADQIEALMKASITEVHPLMLELRLKQVELWRLRVSSEPDETAIQSKQEEIASLRQQIREIRGECRQECLEQLTEEQREILKNRWVHGQPRRRMGMWR